MTREALGPSCLVANHGRPALQWILLSVQQGGESSHGTGCGPNH